MTDTANFETQNQQIPFIQKFVNSYKERTLFSSLLTIFLVLFLYGIFSTDNYLTIFNFKTIIRDAALYGIMAIGLTFVTLSGNFFLLSIKETASICCVAFAVGMSLPHMIHSIGMSSWWGKRGDVIAVTSEPKTFDEKISRISIFERYAQSVVGSIVQFVVSVGITKDMCVGIAMDV